MDNRIVNYKNYVICTEEGEETGIFFRSPLQTVSFDTFGDSMFSASKYANNLRNPIRKLYEILIGNRNIVKNISNWMNELDFGGFDGHILCFPIYFKRKYRKLTATCCDDSNISKIESYGYESEFNHCSGRCHIEKTVVHMSTGKFTKIKTQRQYHFTYAHIVTQVIDTGCVK